MMREREEEEKNRGAPQLVGHGSHLTLVKLRGKMGGEV